MAPSRRNALAAGLLLTTTPILLLVGVGVLRATGLAEDRKLVPVLVAKKTIRPLTHLENANEFFEVKRIRQSTVPNAALTRFEDLKPEFYTRCRIREGDVVTYDSLILKVTFPLPPPPGMQAVPITLNEGILFWCVPGTSVDVVVVKGSAEKLEIKLILEDYLVLGTDHFEVKDQDGEVLHSRERWLLAATPKGAETLSLAPSLGELRLLVRPRHAKD